MRLVCLTLWRGCVDTTNTTTNRKIGAEVNFLCDSRLGEGDSAGGPYSLTGNAGRHDASGALTGGNFSLTGGALAIALDSDVDGVPEALDSVPNNFSPDQSDVDGDSIADVIDPCPTDPLNDCTPGSSTAEFIPVDDGGELATPDGSPALNIPPDALTTDASITITESGSRTTFDLTGNQGEPLGIRY